jgi:site-specific DNA-methyltransferase (adenine-specific)
MIKLIHGDCLDKMKSIPDESIDLVLADLPYQVSACKWDNSISLEHLWCQYKRIIKFNSPIVLFGSQPFTSSLIISNLIWFKYCWIWQKNFSTNFLHAKRQPLRKHEDIVVFYGKPGKYYPQKTTGHMPTKSAKGSSNGELWHGENKRNYQGGDTNRFPTSLIKFNAVDIKKRQHPTQKPIDLLEYLIKTYTNESETVLDNVMGSGSTGIACINTNRKFIGIEKDDHYFQVAQERINNHLSKGVNEAH